MCVVPRNSEKETSYRLSRSDAVECESQLTVERNSAALPALVFSVHLFFHSPRSWHGAFQLFGSLAEQTRKRHCEEEEPRNVISKAFMIRSRRAWSALEANLQAQAQNSCAFRGRALRFACSRVVNLFCIALRNLMPFRSKVITSSATRRRMSTIR